MIYYWLKCEQISVICPTWVHPADDSGRIGESARLTCSTRERARAREIRGMAATVSAQVQATVAKLCVAMLMPGQTTTGSLILPDRLTCSLSRSLLRFFLSPSYLFPKLRQGHRSERLSKSLTVVLLYGRIHHQSDPLFICIKLYFYMDK